jgi:hypothetical protein
MASGPACVVLRLQGSPEDIGRTQAAFILSNETYSNVASLRSWRAGAGDPRVTRPLARALERWNNTLLDEMEATADALGTTASAILESYLPRTTSGGPDGSGCTMVGVAACSMPRQEAGCTIAGRNFDLGYSRADVRVLLTSPGLGLASVGCGGWFGRFDGINEARVIAMMAMVETSRRQPAEPGAIPPTLVLRTLLERARTPCEALALLREIPAWSPTNYLVAGPSDPPVVVERAPGVFLTRSPCRAVVVATNHFLGAADARRASLHRYEALASREASSLSTVKSMAGVLREVADPRLTRWTEIFQPETGTVFFSGGYDASFLRFRIMAGSPSTVEGPLPYRPDGTS